MGQYRPLPVLSAFQTLTSDGPQWLSMPPIRSATTGMRSPAESGDRHKGDRTVQRVFPRLAGPLRGAGKYSKKRSRFWIGLPPQRLPARSLPGPLRVDLESQGPPGRSFRNQSDTQILRKILAVGRWFVDSPKWCGDLRLESSWSGWEPVVGILSPPVL